MILCVQKIASSQHNFTSPYAPPEPHSASTAWGTFPRPPAQRRVRELAGAIYLSNVVQLPQRESPNRKKTKKQLKPLAKQPASQRSKP